jgi:uncharacterized repeat protein (TIGR01451 family)
MKRLLAITMALAAYGFAHFALAVGTVAGTDIDNTAQVSYEVDGNPVSENSNTLTVTVAEILDVDVTLQSPQVLVSPGDSNQELLFTVTNVGNGSEAFALLINSALAGDDFDPTPATPSIYFDTDGSGDLSPGDTPYNPGTNDPVLSPDASVDILLANDIPAGVVDGDIGQSELTATAATGSGAPGDVVAGAGDNGVDAVVGANGASDADSGEYVVSDVELEALKSATVLDPFGGTQPVPAAQITYQVVVTVMGSGMATNTAVSDLIPPNTTYVPGSITLNGGALTDTPDGDAGAFIASGTPTVTVQLGDIDQASGPQTVTFSVVID